MNKHERREFEFANAIGKILCERGAENINEEDLQDIEDLVWQYLRKSHMTEREILLIIGSMRLFALPLVKEGTDEFFVMRNVYDSFKELLYVYTEEQEALLAYIKGNDEFNGFEICDIDEDEDLPF